MKVAAIASVLSILVFCVPLITRADESLPESTEVVQTQSNVQPRSNAQPDVSRTGVRSCIMTFLHV